MQHNSNKLVILSSSAQPTKTTIEIIEKNEFKSCQTTPRDQETTPRDFFVETEISSILTKENHVDFMSDINGRERCSLCIDLERSCNPPL